MDNFEQPVRTVSQSFESKLESLVNQYELNGKQGTSFNKGETIIANTDMSPEIFKLGCELRNHPNVNPYNWAAWMRDTKLTVLAENIIIDMRSQLFCNEASYRFKEAIEKHFNKPVQFKPSYEIKKKVNARVA